METVAIAAHVPLPAAIRVPIVAVVGIPLRAAGIQLPVAAEAAGIQLPVAAEVAGIQLPVAAEVVAGSTPPEATTTGLITDDKNFELLPGGPPSRPLFCLLFLSL